MRAYYNGILSGFPFEKKYIETPFGQTFLLAAGDCSKPPIMLLHGSNSNSAFWFPEIMALSATHRVYAVDILGEAGNSEEYRPDLCGSDFADWLKSVQEELGIDTVCVVGNSLGGWMALKFAAEYPERVSSLILLASAGLAPVRNQFLQNVRDAGTEDGFVPISADILGESDIPKEILEFMNLIAASYEPIRELPVFEDDRLSRLKMPLAFIDGDKDEIIDCEASAKRLMRLVPNAKIHIVHGGGHVITNAIEYIRPLL